MEKTQSRMPMSMRWPLPVFFTASRAVIMAMAM